MRSHEEGDSPAALSAEDDLRPSVLLRQLAGGLVVMMALVGVLAWVAREPVEAASAWFVGTFGIAGVFVGVLLIDISVFTNEPLLFLGYQGGLGYWSVLAAASAASVLAGPVGWAIGRMIGRSPWVQQQIRSRHIDVFLRRYGFWAVTIAALTPIPYSLATYASGASKVPLAPVLLGSLFRVPKTLFYFELMLASWNAVVQ